MSLSSSLASSSKLDFSIPINRQNGSTLDPKAFRKEIPIIAAKVDASRTNALIRSSELKHSLLNLPRIRNVEPTPSLAGDQRLVLLRASSEDDLPPSARQFLLSESQGIVPYQLTLDYSYWTADDVLRAILPEDLTDGSPTGFTITGHIAHLNLRDEYLPYKHLIGQVILDKNPSLRTVVNKLDTIDHQFRFFKMELLAGEPYYIVEVHESNCRFKFDFSTVYWNSRLHTEHERLVSLFQPGEIIADGFAGVGPFAIPAAKRGCGVYANDLNPRSVEFMDQNVALNNVRKRVRTSLLDGGAFIRRVPQTCWDSPFTDLHRPLSKRSFKLQALRQRPQEYSNDTQSHRRISHFVMNLPETAIEFLGNFKGLLSSLKGEPDFHQIYHTMPLVHCHCFTRELELDSAERDIRKRVQDSLGGALGEEVFLHFVRSVAPNKDMYCISFRLPESVAIQ